MGEPCFFQPSWGETNACRSSAPASALRFAVVNGFPELFKHSMSSMPKGGEVASSALRPHRWFFHRSRQVRPEQEHGQPCSSVLINIFPPKTWLPDICLLCPDVKVLLPFTPSLANSWNDVAVCWVWIYRKESSPQSVLGTNIPINTRLIHAWTTLWFVKFHAKR